MIDVHTHILPNVDDGSASCEESAAILSELKNQGVDTVVLTPHYYGKTRSVDEFLSLRQNAYKSLLPFIPAGMEVVLGAEVNIASYKSRDFSQFKPLAIENTHYILIEMPHQGEWNRALFNKIDDIIDSTDLTPIIAHAEKFVAVQNNPEFLADLIDRGCLIQCTCDSLVNDKPLTRAMLKHKQITCLGSDAHNMGERFPFYKGGADEIEKSFGKETLDAIQNNMRKLLQDKDVFCYADKPIKKFLGFYI